MGKLLFCMLGVFFATSHLSFCDEQSSASQNDYRRYVKHVTSEKSGNNTVALITLSDESTWNFAPPPEKESLLFDLEKDFYEGNEAVIMLEKNSYRLAVTSARKQGVSYLVGLTKTTKAQLPYITKIKEVKLPDAGWFSSSFYFSFELSDGSAWELTPSAWYGCLDILKWSEKDRIIVTKQYNHWNLINTDMVEPDPKEYRTWFDGCWKRVK